MFKEITSLQNDLVKHWVRLLNDSDYREEQKLFIMEGLKALRELPGGVIKRLIYTDPQLAKGLNGGEEYKVTEAVMKKISGTSTPEGILAEVGMPLSTSLDGYNCVLALDGINDPGNMGTLMRTALAFGWESIILLPGCCDPYNDKVVRAARGAHFRIPIVRMTPSELGKAIHKNQWMAFVADLEGVSPEKINSLKSCLLVLGSEAKGPSEDVKKFCKKVTLPMPGQMESLNVAVAGGILMYLLRPK